MLNNFTGGGQIFLHNLRMFIQVLGRSIVASCLLALAIIVLVGYSDLSKINLSASLTYQKALLISAFDKEISSIRRIINPSRSDKKSNNYTANTARSISTTTSTTKSVQSKSTINAYTKDSLYKANISPSSVLTDKKLAAPYHQAVSLLKKLLLMWLILTALAFTIIFVLWTRFGKATKEKKHISGHIVKLPKEVAIFLRKNNKASDLTIGNVPLVKDSEVKHILITGSTGSGKTNCLHSLLPKIRQKGQPAIIVDTEGDMVARYYRPGKDIIINPFDKRAHHWDFWQEIKSNRDLKKVATSFFPDSPPDAFDYDKKWTSWGRMLFIGILEYLRTEEIDSKEKIISKGAKTTKESATIENLYNLIHKETLASLSEKLKNTSVGSLISSSGDNNAAPHNIRINTLLATEWLEFIEDINETNKNNSFCFHDWIGSLDHTRYSNGNDQWVFIACDGADNKILLPFISVLTDIALNTLIGLGTNRDRRLWFVFDELAKLKYLPTLQENITLLRKYGGCVLAATQSLNQLFSIYGRNSGSVMLGQFNTNIIFRILSADESRILTKRIGEIEYLSHQKNTSYGAHEFRDGISYTEQEKKQDVIQASDLAKLEEGECYILLPIPAVAICKTTLKLVPEPQALQPSFIYNPETESLISKRQTKWQELNKIQQQRQKLENTRKARAKGKIEQKKQKIDRLIKEMKSNKS